MRSRVVFCLAWALLFAGCDRKPVAPSATQPSAIPSTEPSARPASASATVEAAPAPELGPAPETASREAREQKVLDVLAGAARANELPVIATEPGEKLDPNLRESLAPRRDIARIRSGAVTVVGALPKEVVQRIMRQRFSQLRLCYERGLAGNPNLQGRITLRLKIAEDGKVTKTENAGSDLPDAGVVACFVRVASQVLFPQPEGGTVVATVPFVLEPTRGL